MGNYLSSGQNSNHTEIPEQQIANYRENSIDMPKPYEFLDIPEKNIGQPNLTPEFYKSRRNNKFASLESAIGLK
jgi:hypothetical protein